MLSAFGAGDFPDHISFPFVATKKTAFASRSTGTLLDNALFFIISLSLQSLSLSLYGREEPRPSVYQSWEFAWHACVPRNCPRAGQIPAGLLASRQSPCTSLAGKTPATAALAERMPFNPRRVKEVLKAAYDRAWSSSWRPNDEPPTEGTGSADGQASGHASRMGQKGQAV